MGTIAIHQFNLKGQHVHTFANALRARKACGATRRDFFQCMDAGLPLNGFIYRRDREVKTYVPKEEIKPTSSPWEGKDGMFDIDGWRKAMGAEPSADAKLSRPVTQTYRIVKPQRRRA